MNKKNVLPPPEWSEAHMCPSPSTSTSIILGGCGATAQVWPCPVQYPTGDCPMAGCGNLQSSQFSSHVPYGHPSSDPLVRATQQREEAWTQTLLAFPWHCHRACPPAASCPLWVRKTWVWQEPAAGYSRSKLCINVETISLKKTPETQETMHYSTR